MRWLASLWPVVEAMKPVRFDYMPGRHGRRRDRRARGAARRGGGAGGRHVARAHAQPAAGAPARRHRHHPHARSRRDRAARRNRGHRRQRRSRPTRSTPTWSGASCRCSRCALPWVGHFQTRNRGTLGGSVAHADPSAEIPLCLVVSDGTVVLRSRKRERRVRARDFFLGTLTTARRPDELIVALEWPRAPADAGPCVRGDRAAPRRFRHCGGRLPGSPRRATTGSLRSHSGSAGSRRVPGRCDTTAFIGQSLDEALAREIAEHATRSLTAMQDHAASADYRARAGARADPARRARCRRRCTQSGDAPQ